ncbi:MAG TPA: oxygenase MpaB family protein [Dongiaceae bacterium]|nr:oxygenase MpaB family protein [Dongiaceae bacterium]
MSFTAQADTFDSDTATLETNSVRRLEPKPLGPDSCTWRDFGSYLFHLMLPQAFILQSAHPMIDAAVSKEKKYKLDPWGRAKGSVALLWPVVYARPEKAVSMGKSLREMHRQIKGVDKNGKAYHALDPEAYCWVHMTGFDATIRMYEMFGTPVSAAERACIFAEWKQMGAMLGIIDKHIPQTEEEYWKQFNTMIEERLVHGDVMDDLMSPWFFANYPKPPQMTRLPNFLWKAMATPVSWFMHKITINTLPESFRRKFQVRVGAVDRLAFRAFALLVRVFYPLTPHDLRYIPLARRAIKDARRHPEAYQFNYQ